MLTIDRVLVRLMNRQTPIGPLPTFSELTFTQEDMAPGVWTLETSLTDHQDILSEWLGSAHAGIQVWSPDNDHRALGYLKDYTLTETADGVTLRAAGFDWLGLLDDRLIWPSDTMDLADFWNYEQHLTVDTAARVAREWVARIVLASVYSIAAFDRELPIPSEVEPLAASGPIVTVVGDALPTLQRIRELLTGTGSTVRMVPDVLNTQGRILADFVVGDRPKSPTVLSVDEGTLGEVSSTFRAAEATKVIGVGAQIGAGPQREVAEASNLAPVDWKRRYIERFINEPNLSGADLLAACQEELAAAGPTQSVVAAQPRAGIWGTDLDVGWFVDVAVRDYRGDAETFELPVIATTLTVNARGVRRTIELGSAERRELSGVLASIGSLRSEVERLKRRV